MAPDEQLIEPAHASRSGGASKALGVLAAVSAGGLMAMRMKPASFMFLAGAAAVALLSRKRVIPASRPLGLLPERPPEPPANPRVEVDAWLARQIEREQHTPVITLDIEHLPESTPPFPEPLETAQATSESITEKSPDSTIHSEPIFLPANPTLEVPAIEVASPQPSLWNTPSATPLASLSTEADVGALTTPAREVEPDRAGFVFGAAAAQEPHAAKPLASSHESALPFLNLAPAPGDLYPATPAGAPNASWLLGIEPLPSWDELAADPASTPSKSPSDFAFLSEPPGAASYTEQPPPPAAAPPIQPLFVPSLFQGGALPDEITVTDEPPSAPLVAPVETQVFQGPQESVMTRVPVVDVPSPLPLPAETPAEAPVQVLEPSPAIPVGQHPPSLWLGTDIPSYLPPAAEAPISSVAELPALIPVSLASPGDASFDDPLAALEENPSSLPGGPPPPPPLRPLAPVVEAEIVVRPRGLGTATIQPKQAPHEPAEIAAPAEPPQVPVERHTAFVPSPENSADSQVPFNATAPPALPPAPVVLPREQKARKTWRSWWRGD